MEKNNEDIAWEILKNSFDTSKEDEVAKSYEKLTGWSNFKNKFVIARNSIKFNFIYDKNAHSIFGTSVKGKINLFHHEFYSNPEGIEEDNPKIQKLLSHLLYFCYRSKFPPIENIKKHNHYTSDSGWGCMIRCCQMILSRALYKMFKHLNFKTYKAIFKTLIYFMETPFLLEELPDDFVPIMNWFLKQSYTKDPSKEVTIKSFTAPFSIKNICGFGKLFNKTAGEWFSDVYLSQIVDMINTHFKCFPQLKILCSQSCITLSDLVNGMFTKDNTHLKNTDNSIMFRDEKWYYNKMGLIFVSVRLGINKIAEEYINQIKTLFSCKQCIGFIGGKQAYAYYFIGYNESNFFYLDPHITKETAKSLKNEKDLSSYLMKDIHWLPFHDLQTSFTIGFMIRDFKEYNEFIKWVEEYTKGSFPCFGFINNSCIENKEEVKYDINMEDDDF